LELECIDRIYLNAFVPKLTSEKGIAGYFREFMGHRFASTKSAGKRLVAEGNPEALWNNDELRAAYLGGRKMLK
jgi:hypothetical protein